MNRRTFLRSLSATAATVALIPAGIEQAAAAVNHAAPVAPASKGLGRALKAPEIVPFPANYTEGMIVILLSRKKLYLTIGEGRAIAYPVAVGRSGKAWTGMARIAGKQANPDWIPPSEVKHDNPNLPDIIPGGAPNNPMGPRALVLDRSEIAIHGTTASMRKSIGTAASYGCIRMYNEDVVDLFDRVRVGTPVVAIG